jgi:hypothetical protein
MANEHEMMARARKVARLVEVIDLVVSKAGLDPNTDDATRVADLLLNGGIDWNRMAVNHGINPPSEETRRQVVETYRQRAKSFAEIPEHDNDDWNPETDDYPVIVYRSRHQVAS